jgi:cystathionine beta-lyase/cystathionine gamma-synthase
MSRQDRERIGVTDDLLRISCGIENARDLIADFTRALENVERAARTEQEPALQR